MNEKYIKGRFSDASDCGTTSTQPETLPGMLAEIEKLSSQLRDMTGQASENLNGSQPNSSEKSIAGRGSSIMSTASEIRIILREAIANQQATLNTLAL